MSAGPAARCGGTSAQQRGRSHADGGARGRHLERVKFAAAAAPRRRRQTKPRGELRSREGMIRHARPAFQTLMENVRVPIRELRDGRAALGEAHAHHGRRGRRPGSGEERSDGHPHGLRPRPGVPNSHTTSEQSPVTATSCPPCAYTNAARPGSTSGGIAPARRGVQLDAAVFEKDGGEDARSGARVARESPHRSVHRVVPAAEHTTSQCRSAFRASSMTGPAGAASSFPSAAAAAAAAAAKGSASPPSSWQCNVPGVARAGSDAAPAGDGASIITVAPPPPPPPCDIIAPPWE